TGSVDRGPPSARSRPRPGPRAAPKAAVGKPSASIVRRRSRGEPLHQAVEELAPLVELADAHALVPPVRAVVVHVSEEAGHSVGADPDLAEIQAVRRPR